MPNDQTDQGGLVLPVWLRIRPGANRMLWKAHRALLRHLPLWWPLQCPGLPSCRVRYFAEGSAHYLLEVLGWEELLRIRRDQFYHPSEPTGTADMLLCLEVLNLLAREGLAVSARHLWGGCALVERAGESLAVARGVPPGVIMEVFDRLRHWSLQTGWVVTDLVEENFCMRQGRPVLVDVGCRRLCRLDNLATDRFMARCLAKYPAIAGFSPRQLLDWFLERERSAILSRLQ